MDNDVSKPQQAKKKSDTAGLDILSAALCFLNAITIVYKRQINPGWYISTILWSALGLNAAVKVLISKSLIGHVRMLSMLSWILIILALSSFLCLLMFIR